ncbi:MAG: DUF1931 domain-containing protein [Euryarchaeota archaeon]|jgi:histone H3/H4|nr:DUF1931 domain-containing protein [Euryarchaeota archaeon]
MTHSLVNQSKVKDVAGKFRVSASFYAALEARLVDAIEQAKTRAEANGRNTLMPHDL